MNAEPIHNIPTVVIAGAGFGGVRAAQAFANAPVQVVLIDRNNYHLFQPLLYQVAMTSLQPEDIIYPVRTMLRGQSNARFLMAEVQDFDLDNRKVLTSAGEVAYDYLIVATGGVTNFFGLKAAEEHGFGLKDMEDAVGLRNHILGMVERAVWEKDEERRRAMLTFVVVGGGPTGVESAGSISELLHQILPKDYPALNRKEVRVVLLEAVSSLLVAMPERLRNTTAKNLLNKGVEVCFGAKVIDYDGDKVTLHGEQCIPAKTLIWAAGVQAAAIVEKLGVKQGSMRRVVVTPTLQVAEHPEIFVIGDAAHFEEGGRPLPMIAPVAMQQADRAVENIKMILKGDEPQKYVYKDLGALAIIGRNDAVARMGNTEMSGFFAWAFWLLVHVVRLVGFRHRLFIVVNWLCEYFFYERASRVIMPDWQKWLKEKK